MEAPPHIPPLPQIDSGSPLYFGFNEPPLRPPFMASTMPNDGQNAGQNYDRRHDPDVLPPPPPPQPPADLTIPPTDVTLPAADFAIPPVDFAIPPTAFAIPPADPTIPPPNLTIPPPDAIPPVTESGEQELERSNSDRERQSESDDGSGSDRGESEAEGEQQAYYNQWQAIEEDRSAPCEDELAYIASKGEHSALDYAYWEKKTFFDLDDPEIFPVASGRIDWLVEPFNGTRENPNKEYVMRSPIVHVGGYDWRIKFYPKGNQSDYLSVYLECVTMQSEEFNEFQEFLQPPLPFLDSREKLKKRASEAVQLGVVMYNPSEPRVYEYQCDAHQFTKKSPDYGWTRFTHYSRREFSYRMHGQRQAILRDDKLAFSAYIRIVNDPTDCMWAHGLDCYHDSIALTGIRPFSTLTPMFAAKIPLLHFAPFRKFIYKCQDGKMVFWLQCLLWKMLSRTRSQNYGNPIRSTACDAVAWLRKITFDLRDTTDAKAVIDLFGTFDPEQGAAIGSNKLKTKNQSSVQAAVDAHPTPIATPALLTLELEREEFDRESRKWNKITNKVEMQNRIIVAGKPYILYAFSTHCGDLTSNKFNIYVRPKGPETLWYAYTDGNVNGLTHKQAVDAHCGFSEPTSPLKESRHSSPRHRRFYRFEEWNEVAHVVYYVRDDHRNFLVDSPAAESWEVLENVKEGKLPQDFKDVPEPPQTAKGPGEFSAEQQREIDAHIERARRNSSEEFMGAATPSGWIMDGDDIVMSDVEAESVAIEDETPSPEIVNPDCTIECLGREYYKGPLLGGLYHGEGHLISMNGDEYIGSFLGGEKSGYGKMVYAQTGNIYEGQWAEDKHHGQGKLTEAKTGNVFEGGWKHGKKSGQFMLQGTVTEEDKGCCSICYDKDINTAFYDCGHVIACRECAHKIDTCPICRRRVVARLELFGVKMTFE